MSNGIPPPPPVPVAPPPPPPPPPPPAPGLPGKSKKKDNASSQTKYRRFAWKKIPEVQITNAETIWSPKENSASTPRLSVDISTIQELFAVKDVGPKIRSPSPRGTKANPGSQDENQGPVTLLDTKQSMNINIFLRQFKRSIKDVVEAIQECDTALLSADKLRTLNKLIPEREELKKLEEFKGDESRLDDADKFVLGILKIPSYKLRIECAILRDEYTPAIKEIERCLDILQKAMHEIRNCLALPALLHLVLQAGNVLNQGVSYGNASGFRLDSLKKLSETKANQPGITMMHYVAMELEKQDHLMMRWTEELPSLSKACRISATEVRNDLAALRKKVQTIKDCVERDKSDDLKEKIRGFMKAAEIDLKVLSQKEDKVAEDCNDLALYLCEQPSQFSLEECFNIVDEFRNKFIQASKENARKEKLKAKRERNKNISSHSFSNISVASRLSVDDSNRSLDDGDFGHRNRHRRNTVDITRRRQRSPMPGRPVSDPAKTGSQREVDYGPDVENSLQKLLDSRLDFKVERVTMTKLEPIQRQASESIADTLSARERETAWGVAYKTGDNSTRQIDPSVTKRYSRGDDADEDARSVGEDRPIRRRYRSSRSGLWDSEDGEGDSRDKREYFGSTNSLNTLTEDVEKRDSLEPPADNKERKDYLSPRERIKLRHSNRRVRTDLQLAEDTYVTRTGEILPINPADRSSSHRPRSEEFRYRSQDEEGGSNRRSRHDDLRERIRKYKEESKQENRTPTRQASEESSDYSLRRSRPASDGGSINRLSRIFEKRSVSYTGEDRSQRRDQIISENSFTPDIKLEDVTQVPETSTLVTPSRRIDKPIQNESSPISQKPIFNFEIGPPSSDDATTHEKLKTQKTSSTTNQKHKTDEIEQKNVIARNIAIPNSSSLEEKQIDESENISVFSAEDQNEIDDEVKKENTEPDNHQQTHQLADDGKTVLDQEEPKMSAPGSLNIKRGEKPTHAASSDIVRIYAKTPEQPKAVNLSDEKNNSHKSQLKSGVSEILGKLEETPDKRMQNDVVIEENISAEDAFSLLVEKELESVEIDTQHDKISPRDHTNKTTTAVVSAKKIDNNNNNNNNAKTSLKSLGDELKHMKEELKSKRVTTTTSTPPSTRTGTKKSSAAVKVGQNTAKITPRKGTDTDKKISPTEKTKPKSATTTSSTKKPASPTGAKRSVSVNRKTPSPKSSTVVSPSAKSISNAVNRSDQKSRNDSNAVVYTRSKSGNSVVTLSSTVQRTRSSNSSSTAVSSPTTTNRVDKTSEVRTTKQNSSLSSRSGPGISHDTNSLRRAPRAGANSFMGLRGRNSPLRSSTNSINRIGSNSNHPGSLADLRASKMRNSTDSINRLGTKSTKDIESNNLARNRTAAKSNAPSATRSNVNSRHTVIRSSTDSINKLGSKTVNAVESNTLPRTKSSVKAKTTSGAPAVAKTRPSPSRGSSHSIDKIGTDVKVSFDSTTLPRLNKSKTTTPKSIAATVARLARPRSIASANDLQPKAVSKRPRSTLIENPRGEKRSPVKIEYLKTDKESNKMGPIADKSAQSAGAKSSRSTTVEAKRGHNRKETTNVRDSTLKVAKKPANISKSVTESSPHSKKLVKSELHSKSITRSDKSTTEVATRKSKVISAQDLANGEIAVHIVRKSTATTKKAKTEDIPVKSSPITKERASSDPTRRSKNTQQTSLEKSKTDDRSDKTPKTSTTKSSPSTKANSITKTSKVNKATSHAKSGKPSSADSGLRSASSSNLSSRPSSPKKKLPPSSYRPLKDSISARSTSSISSTVSNGSVEVTMTRTTRLRLSKLNLSKK